MAVEATLPSHLHRISPAEYRRLVEAGVFDEDARIELIDGFLVDMSPKTRAHENAIAWLIRLLVPAVDLERFEVRIASPLTIGTSEPEPDAAVIERSAPRPHHPATAALIVEVAVSSLTRDLRDKPRIYAGAGVPEYWVVDVAGRRAVMHGEPVEGAYTRIESVGRDGELRSRRLGLPPLSVAALLAAAER